MTANIRNICALVFVIVVGVLCVYTVLTVARVIPPLGRGFAVLC